MKTPEGYRRLKVGEKRRDGDLLMLNSGALVEWTLRNAHKQEADGITCPAFRKMSRKLTLAKKAKSSLPKPVKAWIDDGFFLNGTGNACVSDATPFGYTAVLITPLKPKKRSKV